MTDHTIASPSHRWWTQPWLLALILVVATFLSYQPAWHGEALFDDDDHLTSPELSSAKGLARIWTELGVVSQYYPITHSAFWVENRLWGHAMFGYHLVNIFLHVFCAFLFLKTLQRLTLPGAWLAAAIFVLHPVHAESVAWISELKNTLSTVFYLGAALVYLHFDLGRKRVHYLAALGLFVAGLLSKSVTASLPAALLVVFWWQRGRLSWSRDIRPLLPFFILGICSGLFTAWIERRFIGAEGAAFDLSLVQRVLIAGRTFWFYLGKLIWPADLTFIYPRWQVSATAWWQYLYPVAALALFATLWKFRASSRGPLTAMLLFAGTLFPVMGFLNIYPFRYSFVADHYVYLASLGVIAATAAGLTTVFARWPGARSFVASLLGLGLLAGLTWHQSHIYHDPGTVWKDTLAKNPGCFVAHSNLGLHLLQRGQTNEAIPHLQQARALQPEFAEIHNNLGNALREQGRLDEARALYEKALQLRPDLAQAHYNLGALLLQQHQPNEALPHFQKAVELRPEYVDARINLAGLLLDQGRPAEALPHARQALALRPDFPDALTNLANTLLALGHADEALPHYQKTLALQPNSAHHHYNLAQAWLALDHACEAQDHLEKTLALQPDFARAHPLLGHLLLAQGRHQAAARHYQTALELNPDDLDTTCNLAWLFATCAEPTVRNGAQALIHVQRANTHFTGQNPQVLQILAAAYAENNQYGPATDTARQALALAQNNPDLTRQLQAQLQSYEAHSPWRTP